MKGTITSDDRRRVIDPQAVDDTAIPRIRTSLEIVKDSLDQMEMKEVYARRINLAAEQLLSRHGGTELGEAIRDVAETLTAFLPVEKSCFRIKTAGKPMDVLTWLSRHTDLVDGPWKGGTRVVGDMNTTMIQTLSSDMTRKLALLGLGMNGLKIGVRADSGELVGDMRYQLFSTLTKQHMKSIGPLGAVPAGDVGSESPDVDIMVETYAESLQKLARGILAGEKTVIYEKDPEGHTYEEDLGDG